METLFEGHLKLTCLSSISPQVWGKFSVSMGFRHISADEHTTNTERVLRVYRVYLLTKLRKLGQSFLRNVTQFLPFDYAGRILHAFGANFRHTRSGIRVRFQCGRACRVCRCTLKVCRFSTNFYFLVCAIFANVECRMWDLTN